MSTTAALEAMRSVEAGAVRAGMGRSGSVGMGGSLGQGFIF